MAWICDNRIKNGVFSATRPLYVRRSFNIKRGAVGALLTCTAMGIYSAKLNGVRVGSYFLTPGFTSYKKHLQCQSYDITSLLKEGENLLEFNVSGGWAVDPYGLRRRKGIYFDRPALNFRLDTTYVDGQKQSIVSDGSCLAGMGKYISASIYNGEIYDASAAPRNLRSAAEEAGYARSVIKPVVGGGLTGASAYTLTPHGKISSSWRIADGTFTLEATVPQGTTCRIIMPSGIVKEVGGGHYKFAEKFKV